MNKGRLQHVYMLYDAVHDYAPAVLRHALAASLLLEQGPCYVDLLWGSLWLAGDQVETCLTHLHFSGSGA